MLGGHEEPRATTLSRAEVRQLPGAFGDPFRAIEALPGVTPIVSGVPFLYVRGAAPGNVGYFLDGIRLPLLYHLASPVTNPAPTARSAATRASRAPSASIRARSVAPRLVARGDTLVIVEHHPWVIAGADHIVELGPGGGQGGGKKVAEGSPDELRQMKTATAEVLRELR